MRSALSTSPDYTGGGAIALPSVIATDSAGNVWITGNHTFITELVGAAVPVETLTVQAFDDSCLGELPCQRPLQAALSA